MKIFKCIWRFIYMHPILTMLIGMLVSSFISYMNDGNKLAGPIIFLICYCFFLPFIKRRKEKELRKQELDYLAKKTAEEIAKTKTENGSEQDNV